MTARALGGVLSCCLVLTALSGCAAVTSGWAKLSSVTSGWAKLSSGDTVDAVPEPALAPVERRLTEAALRAETALTTLAWARAAENPLNPPPLPRIVPAALLRLVTLDWTGPLETLAAKLSGEAGYSFEVVGRRPVRPVMVAVEAADKPLILVLRDVGIQAGAAAMLSVDAGRRRIELAWRPRQGEEVL